MMVDDSALELVREMLIITLKIAAPILLAGVLVGLIISILQAITSIQDQGLATVPKLVAMVAVAILLLPWIVERLVEYTQMLFRLPLS